MTLREGFVTDEFVELTGRDERIRRRRIGSGSLKTELADRVIAAGVRPLPSSTGSRRSPLIAFRPMSGGGTAAAPQVLVVGAGPTGLLLAAELERRDVPCLLIDELDRRGAGTGRRWSTRARWRSSKRSGSPTGCSTRA